MNGKRLAILIGVGAAAALCVGAATLASRGEKPVGLADAKPAAQTSPANPARDSGGEAKALSRNGSHAASADLDFLDGYAEGGSAGCFCIDCPPVNSDRISAAATGAILVPSFKKIEWGSTGGRSRWSMWLVFKDWTWRLRYIYKRYLKTNPDLAGRLVLRFTIAPDGKIVRIAVVKSTTGAPDMDEEIMRKAEKSFVFEANGKSDATLTVPFEFLPRDE